MACEWDKVEVGWLVPLAELTPMPTQTPAKITHLLHHLQAGDRAGVDRLFDAVYQGLRNLAEQFFRREPPGQTIQPTALVHEAYLKLIDQTVRRLAGPGAFPRRGGPGHAPHPLGSRPAPRRRQTRRRLEAADTQRQAHSRLAGRRGSGGLGRSAAATGPVDPRQAQMVELRFFAGLSVEETAKVLGISKRSAEREWTMVRAWLRRELSNSDTA